MELRKFIETHKAAIGEVKANMPIARNVLGQSHNQAFTLPVIVLQNLAIIEKLEEEKILLENSLKEAKETNKILIEKFDALIEAVSKKPAPKKTK